MSTPKRMTPSRSSGRKPLGATLARRHKWAVKPLAVRATPAYRNENPPPVRVRACAVCGLEQSAAPASWGAHVNWPACAPCPGPKPK